MKNIYDGVVALDENGECRVELPEWFEALNCDFRYQLTSIGEPALTFMSLGRFRTMASTLREVSRG
jgi:hypothetical protein